MYKKCVKICRVVVDKTENKKLDQRKHMSKIIERKRLVLGNKSNNSYDL